MLLHQGGGAYSHQGACKPPFQSQLRRGLRGSQLVGATNPSFFERASWRRDGELPGLGYRPSQQHRIGTSCHLLDTFFFLRSLCALYFWGAPPAPPVIHNPMLPACFERAVAALESHDRVGDVQQQLQFATTADTATPKAHHDDVEALKRELAACRAALRTAFAAYSDVLPGRLRRLQQLRVFVLDNSLRESTVGQIRGHVLPDKRGIYAAVKKTGIRGAQFSGSWFGCPCKLCCVLLAPWGCFVGRQDAHHSAQHAREAVRCPHQRQL